MKPNSSPTMIDLFAGCGGVTTGFKSKGFKVLAAVEFDPVIAQTYRLNHPEVRLYQEDIKDISPYKMLKRCALEKGELTILTVCAPCQPFSRQNRNRATDERASLVLESLRFIEVFKPIFIFVENVPGLYQNSSILNILINGFEKLGYTVSSPAIVDAANYGVPQFRKRFILIGSSTKLELRIPEITHVSPEECEKLNKQPWITVKDAFEGLSALRSGERSETDPLHRARKHSQLSLDRLKYIPHNGGSRKSLPEELRPKCHRGGNQVGYHDVYGRMSFCKPSNTLTTGCTNFTKGRFAHPVSDRSITPREAARLQTFPDSYKFYGSYDQISTQIGNAVPVRLAEVFADYFYKFWSELSK